MLPSTQITLHTISDVKSSNRRVISQIKHKDSSKKIQHGRTELDSHADTTVAGANCRILHYTGRECDVSPYSEEYSPVKDVPIVQAATTWQSPNTGQLYILIFNEALYMGESLEHSLINPNQLRHYGVQV